jgi:D-arabinose 1-dehydrogenase-like Zn-dependent alcohol dehydrogenase
MPKMRAIQVAKKGGALELVERELPQPDRGEVRVKVQACGVCHSDSIAKEGLFPNVPYPIVPGHEIAGVVDAVGEGVIGWSIGTRVGVGWFGGHCGRCEPCRRGDLPRWVFVPSPSRAASTRNRSLANWEHTFT